MLSPLSGTVLTLKLGPILQFPQHSLFSLSTTSILPPSSHSTSKLKQLVLAMLSLTLSILKHNFSLCTHIEDSAPSTLLLIFSSVQLLSCVCLFATPWTAARQASLSITNSQSLLKLMSIELVMPSNHLILCRPLLLLLSVFPSIRRVCSSESVFCIKWPKYWSFSFSISPSNEYSGLISFRIDWSDLLALQGFSRVFSNMTVQKHQFFGAQLSFYSSSHICTWLLETHSFNLTDLCWQSNVSVF